MWFYTCIWGQTSVFSNGEGIIMEKRKITNKIVMILLLSLFVIANFSMVANAAGGSLSDEEIKERIIHAYENCEKEITFNYKEITYSDYVDISKNIQYSYPEYFYVKGFVSHTYNGVYLKSVEIQYRYDDDKLLQIRQELTEATTKFMSGVNSNWTDIQKLLYINYYIGRTCEYDMTYGRLHNNDPYGVLVEHSAVCAGYALTYQMFARKLGFECYYVTSSKLNHAWNMVKYNDKYYMIDCTWNDSYKEPLGIMTRYFMKSTSWFSTSTGGHNADDYVVEGCDLLPSVANDTSYDNSVWNGTYSYLVFINDNVYGTDNNSNIVKYLCTNSGLEVDKYILDYSKIYWENKNPEGGYFISKPGLKVATIGDKLYYNLSESIYEYDVNNNQTTEIYTLTDEEKSNYCIYGLYINDDNEMSYLLAKDPNKEAIESSITKILESTYKATFDWRADYSKASVKIIRLPITTVVYENENINSTCQITQATCTEPGKEVYEVSVNYNGTNYKDTKEKIINATGHIYDKTVVSDKYLKSAADCTHVAVYYKSCKCGKKSTNETFESGTALGHDYKDVPNTAKKATCLEKGKEADQKCSRCPSKITGREINALGHDYQDVAGTDIKVTCTSDGKEADQKCSRCESIINGKVIKAQGHIEVDIPAQTPTCTEKGHTAGKKCSVCEKIIVATQDIDALGHMEEVIPAAEPTCVKDGRTEGKKCSRCNAELVASHIIKTQGHKWDTGVVTKEATETEKGIMTFTCSVCKETKTEEIPAKSVQKPTEQKITESNQSEQKKTEEDQETTKPTDETTEQSNVEATPMKVDGVGTISGDGTILIDTYGVKYQMADKIAQDKLKKNLAVADKISGGKYKITKVIKTKGKVTGGTVTYTKPYYKNCKAATVRGTVKIGGVTFKVTSVSDNAFKNCKKLGKITIGKNVTQIGKKSFNGCKNLKTVVIKTKNLKKIGSGAFKGINSKATFKVPKTRYEKYSKMIFKAGAPKKNTVTK